MRVKVKLTLLRIASLYMSQYFEPWLDFKHPWVRQLCFAIASPNILNATPNHPEMRQHFDWHDDAFWLQHYIQYLPRLRELDQQPEALLQFFSNLKSTRLGLRFEYLIWFWLQDSAYHDYQLLAHSLQVIEGKQTLGELDFLVYNQTTQQLEHWEVALKYYLGEADLSLPYWYGLNREDTLYKKLHHFSHQQFKFDSIDLDGDSQQIQQRRAVIKGQLYLPARPSDLYASCQALPEWINPTRRLGYWGSHRYLSDYIRLDRSEWLCIEHDLDIEPPQWSSNGLYFNNTEHRYYMYRQVESI